MARRTIKLWQLIIAGPGLIALGIWEYVDLARFEERGGTIWVGRTTAFFYRLGGKSAVLVVMVVGGGLYLWLLLRYLRLHRETQRRPVEPDERELERASTPRPRPIASPRLPSAPRDAGPFRSPPHQPIVVSSPVARPAPAPIVEGDPLDQPKLLK
jgi:hypothetical protein